MLVQCNLTHIRHILKKSGTGYLNIIADLTLSHTANRQKQQVCVYRFPTICNTHLMMLKFSHNQSILRHVSVVATTINKEFTL